MSRRRRARVIARWTCTALALALAACWVVSGWYRFMIVGSNWSAGFHHGLFGVTTGPMPPSERAFSFYLESTRPVWDLKLSWHWTHSDVWLTCSVWIVSLTVGAAAFALWLPDLRARFNRARLRARAGLCPSCAYNRRGLGEGTPCPECGGRDRPWPEVV